MEAKKIEFLGGVRFLKDLDSLKIPKSLPQFAFCGRSNVGKSSLLNALVKQKIARTSSEPGKTREINFFLWDKMILVDLPGYGFAKVSKKIQDEWGREITLWLQTEKKLQSVLVLVDGRHGFFKTDIELLEWLKQEKKKFLVVFTKMDKYKSFNQRSKAEKFLNEEAKKLEVPYFTYVSIYEPNTLSNLIKLMKM
jgi:GTP-binding protein